MSKSSRARRAPRRQQHRTTLTVLRVAAFAVMTAGLVGMLLLGVDLTTASAALVITGGAAIQLVPSERSPRPSSSGHR